MKKKKHTRLKIFLSILGILIVLIAGVLQYIKHEMVTNPPPKSINMGSDMTTMNMGKTPENMKMADTSGSTSIRSLTLGRSAAPEKRYTITAQVVKHSGLPDAYTFNGSVPGPTITVHQGDHVHVTLINHLPVGTTIHWHGVRVPNASDGVAGLTQDAVKPGSSYTYDFIAKDSGTYWYHSHQYTADQVPKGLFGALIVLPTRPVHYDHDYTVMFHDYPLSLSTLADRITFFWQIIEVQLGRTIPKPIAMNGHIGSYTLDAKPGETVRLRMIDASASDMSGVPLRIVPLGVPYKVIAVDGHDINAPQEITKQILPIDTGERYDILFTMPQSGNVQIKDVDNLEELNMGQKNNVQYSLPTSLQTINLTNYGKPASDPLLTATHFDQNITITLGKSPDFVMGL